MKSAPFLLGVALLLLFGSLLYVRSRFLLVEMSYELSGKRSEKAKLEEERRALMLELATLKNPKRIEKIARESLKLTRSESSSPRVLVSEDSR